MKPEEIKARLEKGENPIALSIEHWERNLKRAENNEQLLLHSHNCALCHVYIFKEGSRFSSCTTCPFILHGVRCDTDGSFWDMVTRWTAICDFPKSGREKELVIAIKNLIAELQRFLELEQQAQKESND